MGHLGIIFLQVVVYWFYFTFTDFRTKKTKEILIFKIFLILKLFV